MTFAVYHQGERAAGLHSYSDEVTIELSSGEPGGSPGEFEEHMRLALAEWFDGAKVALGTLASYFEDPIPKGTRCECQECEVAPRHSRFHGLQIVDCQCKEDAVRMVTMPRIADGVHPTRQVPMCIACADQVSEGAGE